MSSAWCSIQNINYEPKHAYKEQVVASLLIESFLMTVCAFWLSAPEWGGWPSVTGNIPGCLKVASTCCGKPTARCRQRKAALKKTNISSEMKFSFHHVCYFMPVSSHLGRDIHPRFAICAKSIAAILCLARGLQSCSHSCKWVSLTSPRMESSSSLWRLDSGTAGSCSWLSVFWSTGASWAHERIRWHHAYTHERVRAHTVTHIYSYVHTPAESWIQPLSLQSSPRAWSRMSRWIALWQQSYGILLSSRLYKIHVKQYRLTVATSITRFSKQNKANQKAPSIPPSLCWLTLGSGRVCGNIPNTGGSESGLLQPADKHHTPPSHWAAPHQSTEYKRQMNDERNLGAVTKKRSNDSASPGFWVRLLELWQRRETPKRVRRRRRRLRGNYWSLRLSAAIWQVEAAKHDEQNYFIQISDNIFLARTFCLLLEVFLFSQCCHDTSHTAKDH